MSRLFTSSVLVLALGAVAFGGEHDNDTKPEGRGNRTTNPLPQFTPSHDANGAHGRVIPITFHGGPVMTAPKNVYYIWYGTGWTPTAQGILTAFGQSIGGSPYFNINTTYTDAAKKPVVNSVAFGSSYTYPSSTTSLTDAQVMSVVGNSIGAGKLPSDPNGVYFVLTSPEVNETSGFCTQYCGWHTHAAVNGVDIKYAFIGNPARCPSACAAQTTSPNGDLGADAAASILAHELEESVTDPDLNAWYDASGQENGDKCAWNFGSVKTAPNGAKYNVTLGGTNFLIQQNWVATTSVCALQYP
jgi:hypothetical protein